MKKPALFISLLSSLLLTFVTASASASTMSFAFSFNNLFNGGGVVTGEIHGLTDGDSSITSFDILSSTSHLNGVQNFGTGSYDASTALLNSWTVENKDIVTFDFFFAGLPTWVYFTSKSDGLGKANTAGLGANLISFDGVATAEDIDLTFTLIEDTTVSEVPVPAALPLMVMGLLVLRKLGKK